MITNSNFQLAFFFRIYQRNTVYTPQRKSDAHATRMQHNAIPINPQQRERIMRVISRSSHSSRLRRICKEKNRRERINSQKKVQLRCSVSCVWGNYSACHFVIDAFGSIRFGEITVHVIDALDFRYFGELYAIM